MHTLHFHQESWSCDAPRDAFTRRLGGTALTRLPTGLREEATGMSQQEFTDAYGPGGAIRLGSWSMESGREDMVTCRATIAYADRIMSLQARAAGPIGAMTSMLGELGASLQIISLHQRETDGLITTFLLCEHDDDQFWTYGSGRTGNEAGVNALIAGANRLLADA